MKIKTIMCNSSKEFYDAHAGRRLAMSTDEVQLVVVNIPHGPDSMESAYDEAIAAPYMTVLRIPRCVRRGRSANCR